MSKYFTKISTAFLALTAPLVTFGQAGPDLAYLESAIDSIGSLVAQLIPIVIAIGLLFFIWGLVQFIAASGDEAAKEEGKRKMVWGILALFVIVAVWGLVGILADLTGIEVGGTVDTPSVDFIN